MTIAINYQEVQFNVMRKIFQCQIGKDAWVFKCFEQQFVTYVF